MIPLDRLPLEALRGVELVLTDIDDTLTTGGRLGAAAYGALWRLHDAGVQVVPVTGRPAGWCDCFARMWPIAGIVGENGALAYAYDRDARRMEVLHAQSSQQRETSRQKLARVRERVLSEVPGAGVASDQPFRLYDLAIDFCEDVPALDADAVETIAAIFRSEGATAKVSSIHVNGWFGDFDKLKMILRFARERLGIDLESSQGQLRAVYVGDSPNDEPAFAFFSTSVGVANVLDFRERLREPPRYVTAKRGGEGFEEVAEAILAARPSN